MSEETPENLPLDPQEQIAAAEARAEEAERRLLAVRVGLEKGLPLLLADRLVGETTEELEADADRLVGYLFYPHLTNSMLLPPPPPASPNGNAAHN